MARARGLFSGAASELRALASERARHRPAAPASGLVLDVGSGQSPNLRADVIVDEYLVDSFELGAGEAFEFTKPVVVADALEGHWPDLGLSSAGLGGRWSFP